MTFTLDPISVQADPGTSPYDAGYLRTIDDGFGNTASFTSGTLDGKSNDWYRVALDSENAYQFTLSTSGTQSYNSPQLTIRGFAGQRMEPFYSNKTNGDVTLRFLPPKDGLYYLDAGIKGDFYSNIYDPVRYNLSVEGELIEESVAKPAPTGESTYVMVQGSTWEECQAAAQNLGGNLVSINSESEQELLMDLFWPQLANDDAWIGLTDRDQEGNWKWLDGSTVTYDNWWPGGPQTWPDPENRDYAYIQSPSGTWADTYNDDVIFQGIAEIPPREETGDPGTTPVPGDGSQPALPQAGAGTIINIGGDNTGNIIIGNQNSVAGNDLITGNNNVTGSGNYIGDNSVNNGVQVIDGRRWDTMQGDETDNIIGYQEGLDRMKMFGGGGVDTFVLGDYTPGRKVSIKINDFNGDKISFDLESLGIDNPTVVEANTRREFKDLVRSDVQLIYFNNAFFNNLNGVDNGLGGGERFAKIQGEDVALDALTFTEPMVL